MTKNSPSFSSGQSGIPGHLPHPLSIPGRYTFSAFRPAIRQVLSPTVIFCTILFLIIGYGYAALVPAVDMDDLALNVYQEDGEFLRQGRFTTWILQALTGIMRYQRFWPEAFAAVCLGIASIFLIGVLNLIAQRPPNTFSSVFFVGAMCLWPYHAEILMFSNQCGIGLGFLLCVIALMFALQHIFNKWRNGLAGAVTASILLCCALGIYESFAAVWLTLLFASLLLRYESDSRFTCSVAQLIGTVLRGLWPLLLAILLRKGIASLLAGMFGFFGENTTSSTSIYWFNRASIKDAFLIFVREWANNYLALFFSVPAITLLDIACLFLLIRLFVVRRSVVHVLLGLGLIFSQFSIGTLQGTGSQLARLTQSFAVFVPFVAWLWLDPYLRKTNWKRLCALLLCSFILIVEGTTLNQTFLFNRARWHYEESILQNVASQLDELDPSRELPVAFSGQLELSAELREKSLIPLNTPTYSAAYVISLAFGGPLGELYRYGSPLGLVINWAQVAFSGNEQMYILMDEIGRPCVPVDPQTQEAADEIAATLPDGSVTMQDGYLLVVF